MSVRGFSYTEVVRFRRSRMARRFNAAIKGGVCLSDGDGDGDTDDWCWVVISYKLRVIMAISQFRILDLIALP